MPTEAAVLSSWLRKPAISYFNNFHPWIYETIHFTVDKPWRRNNHPDHPFVCKMLFEWNETMKGVEKYYDILPPIENDYLRNCGEKGSHKKGNKLPKPDEQCAFCKGGIPTPDVVVPQTGSNSCSSIKQLAVKEYNGTDTCKIIQEKESACCPEPEQSNHLALMAPAGNARSEEDVIVDIAAIRGGNTTVILNATSKTTKDTKYSSS